MSDDLSDNVPSLKEVRNSVSSVISRIVEYFKSGNRHTASVDEIVDGIAIENNAERSSVYSTIDPYTKNAEKRDEKKPLLFRRTAPAEYTFLGFSGDPLDLTTQMHFSDPILREAYDILEGAMKTAGKGLELRNLSMSRKIEQLHQAILKQPKILLDAQERLKRKEQEKDIIAQLAKDVQL